MYVCVCVFGFVYVCVWIIVNFPQLNKTSTYQATTLIETLNLRK